MQISEINKISSNYMIIEENKQENISFEMKEFKENIELERKNLESGKRFKGKNNI